MLSKLLMVGALTATTTAFAPNNNQGGQPVPDNSTYSNYDEIRTTHMFFDWAADFSKTVMVGSVIHDMTVKTSMVDTIYLDVSGLGMTKQVQWMPPGSAMNATNNMGNIPANTGFNLTYQTNPTAGSTTL